MNDEDRPWLVIELPNGDWAVRHIDDHDPQCAVKGQFHWYNDAWNRKWEHDKQFALGPTRSQL